MMLCFRDMVMMHAYVTLRSFSDGVGRGNMCTGLAWGGEGEMAGLVGVV